MVCDIGKHVNQDNKNRFWAVHKSSHNLKNWCPTIPNFHQKIHRVIVHTLVVNPWARSDSKMVISLCFPVADYPEFSVDRELMFWLSEKIYSTKNYQFFFTADSWSSIRQVLCWSSLQNFFLRGLKTSCDRSAQNKQITDASRFLVFLTEYLPKNSQILSVGRIQVFEQVLHGHLCR